MWLINQVKWLGGQESLRALCLQLLLCFVAVVHQGRGECIVMWFVCSRGKGREENVVRVLKREGKGECSVMCSRGKGKKEKGVIHHTDYN